MCNNRLDARSRFPSGMEEYLQYYGWHFSKRMFEWAVSLMKDRNNNPVSGYSKEGLSSLLSRFGINLENTKGYDAEYVAAMAKADFWGSSIQDEQHLAMYVKDYMDDKDAYEGLPFTRFYADMIGSGTAISWEDML